MKLAKVDIRIDFLTPLKATYIQVIPAVYHLFSVHILSKTIIMFQMFQSIQKQDI